MADIIDVLLKSEEPAIRRLQREVRKSPLVRKLLSSQQDNGRISHPRGEYGKWQGAHWVMATLADIGYPAGDKSLIPVRDQLLDLWLWRDFYKDFDSPSRQHAYRHHGVPVMQGRHRRCASQQSNALWSIMKLGLVNDRTHDLVERLLYWQWPGGGWNCDKNPDAHHSSFMESILPLRALSLYGSTFNHAKAKRAAKQAADIFLKRHLYQRQSDGSVITKEFTKLHYPLYWHYDILHGLKVLAECGLLNDVRAQPALDLLMEKRRPDGDWAAEASYYKVSDEIANGNEFIDWGGTGPRMNPWVTVDALYVARAATACRKLKLAA